MAYKALYRTYRPSTFEEVAGQQHIVKTLRNALSTGKIAHAYLFAGPRGTGKTTMAKLMAKALNCEHGIGCQCNECKNCQAINNGTHPDVLELDAASNNGVEEIRNIIDKVKYGTILGKYKVYIIDEVHMLSTGAFNALLKTLEEPPEHVIFILATTEPHKILPTILSRCQRYDFTRVSDEDIKNRLRIVLDSEGIAYNDDAVKLIVSLADGGMRDALSILDQVLAYSGYSLNEKDILNIFALESTEEKISLLESIAGGNVPDVLDRLNSYLTRGTDIKRLTNDLLLILKDVLIFQTSRKTDYMEVLKEDEVRKVAPLIKQKDLLNMIQILMDTLKDFKNVSAIGPLFEVSLLKLATINNGTTEKEEAEEKPVPEAKADEPLIEVPDFSKKPEEPKEKPKKDDLGALLEEELADPVISRDALILKGVRGPDNMFAVSDNLMISIMVTSKKEIKNQLIENWKSIKKLAAHPLLGKAASLLLDGRPLVSSKQVLILEYPFTTAVEKVNTIDIQKDLQDVIQNIFKMKMFVYAVSRNDSVRYQQNYMNLLQISRLPKADNVYLQFEGE